MEGRQVPCSPTPPFFGVRTIENLERRGRKDLAGKVSPYRAGYTPQQRRRIESDLVEGRLLAVISTDALELGIDIGELDAAVCVTFPGTVAGLRHTATRRD